MDGLEGGAGHLNGLVLGLRCSGGERFTSFDSLFIYEEKGSHFVRFDFDYVVPSLYRGEERDREIT